MHVHACCAQALSPVYTRRVYTKAVSHHDTRKRANNRPEFSVTRVAIDPLIIITSVRDNSRLVPTCRVLYLPFAQRYTNFNVELCAYAPLSPPTLRTVPVRSVGNVSSSGLELQRSLARARGEIYRLLRYIVLH